MTKDKFWKLFWLLFGGMMLIGCAAATSLFLVNTREGDLLAAVGAEYREGNDPFQAPIVGAAGETVTLEDGYLYRNTLPLRFQSWTWRAVPNWHSSEKSSEGGYAIQVLFREAGGMAGISGPPITLTNERSITLAINPDSNVGDLFLRLYDAKGNPIGMQSLGWYTPQGMLVPDTWQSVTIPLENLEVAPSKTITGFSISSKNVGTAYIDSVRLVAS